MYICAIKIINYGLIRTIDNIRPYAKRYEELNRARIKIEEQLPFSIDEHVTTTQARRLITDEIRRNLERIAHKATNIVRANSDALCEGGDDESLRYAREYIKTFDNLNHIDCVISSTLRRGASFDTQPEFDTVIHAADMYIMDVRKHCEEVMLLTLYEYIKRNMFCGVKDKSKDLLQEVYPSDEGGTLLTC